MIVVAPSAFTTVAVAGRTLHARSAAGPLRMTALSERAAAGLDRVDEHAGRVDGSGADAGRIVVALRAAQEQVRQELSGRRVS